MPVQVEVGNRLLDVLEVELLERPDPLDRGRDAPVHVRVDPDLHVGADRGRGSPRSCRSPAPRSRPTLSFSSVCPASTNAAALSRVRLGLVDEQVADHRHLARGSSRRAARPPGRRAPCPSGRAAPSRCRRSRSAAIPLQLREYSSSRWTSHSMRSGSSPTRNCANSRSMIVWIVGQRRAGRLADADEPFVGVDLDDEARGRLADATRPLERLPHRRAHRRRLDACDPQRKAYTRLALAGLSTIRELSTMSLMQRLHGRRSSNEPQAQTVVDAGAGKRRARAASRSCEILRERDHRRRATPTASG